jgi:hypothetical protein
LQHFALDIVSEPLADQRQRRLALAKSRHVGQLRKFLGHPVHRLRHIIRRYLQFQLSPASRFRNFRHKLSLYLTPRNLKSQSPT